MSLTYDTFTTELALLAQFNVTDPNFLSNLPSCIDYATDRITRELDLLSTVTSNPNYVCSISTRIINLATPTGGAFSSAFGSAFSGASGTSQVFNVIRDINVLTPVGITNPDLAARVPLTIQSRAFLNQVYGTGPSQGGSSGVPQYFAMVTDQIIQVAPYPDQAYNLEVIGTVRPVPLSSTNETNWISLYLPDLYLAAAMVQMSGFMKSFGAQSDNPQQAMSWENQYVTLRDSSAVEDAQRKYGSTGWSPILPSQYNPPRT